MHANWDDGWLDGIPYHSLASQDDRNLTYAGLVVWCGAEGSFYLEPFQSRFRLSPSLDDLASYVLCFRSRLETRQRIPYTLSVAKASRRIAIPDAKDVIVESEWRYVFRHPRQHESPSRGDT